MCVENVKFERKIGIHFSIFVKSVDKKFISMVTQKEYDTKPGLKWKSDMCIGLLKNC